MIYFELSVNYEDYLTDKENLIIKKHRKWLYLFKSFLGIVVKKRIDSKYVYIIPKINKLYLRKVKKILDISGEKQVCISNELFYKSDFINLLTSNSVYICNGNFLIKYMLKNILEYLEKFATLFYENSEIAFLVNDNYDLVIEYIKDLESKFKIITIVTNNIKYFNKIQDNILKNYGIELNIINNYKKGLNRSNYIVNIDFSEEEIKKYNIYYKSIFINLNNKYEITNNHFEGVNITNIQISMPDKYLKYSELFEKFEYLYVYESFIKKRTSAKNILDEIEKDNLKIIVLENKDGIIVKDDFLLDNKKILDK